MLYVETKLESKSFLISRNDRALEDCAAQWITASNSIFPNLVNICSLNILDVKYIWVGGSLAQSDTLGNIINNSRDYLFNGKIDMIKLYNNSYGNLNKNYTYSEELTSDYYGYIRHLNLPKGKYDIKVKKKYYYERAITDIYISGENYDLSNYLSLTKKPFISRLIDMITLKKWILMN